MENCDMCGMKIIEDKCSCEEWKSRDEMKDNHMIMALEEFHEMRRFILTGDAPHLGCAIVLFRGDYNDCKAVEKFLHERSGRPHYQQED